jgi:hypothetical protein
MRRGIRHNIAKLTHGKENCDMIVLVFVERSSAKEMFFGNFSNYAIYMSKFQGLL